MASENWIEWQGGEMPVDADTPVEVDFGDNIAWDGKARDFDWSARPDGINMYRVINPALAFAREQLDRA